MPSNVIEVLQVITSARQTVTINTAVTEVAIALPGTQTYLENVFSVSHFKRMDSPLVLGAGLMLPYSYCLSTIPCYMYLAWVGDDGVTEFNAASFLLPAAGEELSFAGGASPGLYLPHPGLENPFGIWSGKARLKLSVITGSVSMVNNPAVLSGSLKVVPWIRLQHNFALEAA